MPSATTPTVNKLQLGSMVRYLRNAAQLTQEQLGQQVWPRSRGRGAQNKVALLESGQTGIHEADLAKIIEVCGVDVESRADLIALMYAKHANTGQHGRWGGYRAVYSETFRSVIDLEEDASVVRESQIEICPDLLQCEEYVRALFARRFEAALPGSFQKAVDARLARGKLLSPERDDGKEPLEYRLVASASCFARVVGNREVMRAQVAHTIHVSKRPNVRLHVVPFETNQAFQYMERFSLLTIPSPGLAGDLDFVLLPLSNDPRYSDRKDEVNGYQNQFESLLGFALDPDESRRFLRERERDLRLL